MILIGLGSNLPLCAASPEEILRLAIRAIGEFATLERVSPFYSSPAWPDASDPPFVNAAISVSTRRTPEDLLARLHEVEAAFGRRRERRNAPRTLDLDLLAYGAITRTGSAGRGSAGRGSAGGGAIRSGMDERGPILPHPGIATRDFVLAPLCDIAPDWICPSTGKTPREMLSALKTVSVRLISAKPG